MSIPTPVNPEVEHSYWLPYLVFSAIGVLFAAIGYGLSAAFSNPTWFMIGSSILLLSVIFDIRGVVCMNR